MGKEEQKVYIAIDLKSFYASVECRERGLDALQTNLVVADPSRTEKTICLAVSPSLKQYGIPGRARLFEVVQKVKQINHRRRQLAPRHELAGKSCDNRALQKNPALELDYITAVPRMKLYMKYSADIYKIYLKYVAPEDIYPYSVDEVFCDLTDYVKVYQMTATELATKMLQDVYQTTGITATGGLGTNLYLAKIAMDIGAKHVVPDKNGVRIAKLDERRYRKLLWDHRPLTDFWRVGCGYAKKLEANRMYTMGDVARCSIENEDLLYQLFGVNAELLIDHSWGYEPCTIQDVKAYQPENRSISSGQVLHRPYDAAQTRLIVKEMTDLLVLDLVDKQLVAGQLVLTIGYDAENLSRAGQHPAYQGEVTIDRYGRKIPKAAHGTIQLAEKTSSTKAIMEAAMELYDKIIQPDLLVRRINLVAGKIESKEAAAARYENDFEQMDMFTDYAALEEKRQTQRRKQKLENSLQHTILALQKKYGKNAVLKGMNLMEEGTTIERNGQVGGHKG